MGDASSPQAPTQTAPTVLPVRISTHNIRFATDTPSDTEKLWPERFPHLSSHFKYHTRAHFAPQATLVCMQEVLHGQLLDLHQKTFDAADPQSTSSEDNDWTYVGVGRDDGKSKGEYSPIFFRKSAWKCIHFETIWLNESGEVGKKGWDADSIRILTCTVLESALVPGKLLLAMNTHLDNAGEVSRRESAKLILNVRSRLRSKYTPSFTFLAGDLNSEPDGDAHKNLNKPGSGFIDARSLIHDNDDGKIYAYGNESTFTDFPGDAGAKGLQRIDFIHLGVDAGKENARDKLEDMVQCYGVLPNRFDDRVWLSDHRGVVVDLLVPL